MGKVFFMKSKKRAAVTVGLALSSAGRSLFLSISR